MIRPPLVLRLAGRELRGGLRGFRVFILCLVIGVGAIAGVGSLIASMQAALDTDSRALLGGDLSIELSGRPLDAAERNIALAHGQAFSETATMRAMARPAEASEARPALVELKAVDGAYPLVGTLDLEPAMSAEAALANNGAVAEQGLLTRLGLELGDRLRIGNAEVTLRALLRGEPDRLTGGMALGPRLIVSTGVLKESGLVQLGSQVRFRYRLTLLPGADLAATRAALEAEAPDAGWRLRDASDANPSLARQLDRLGLFLTLVGLSALVLGGVGIAGAVRAYLEARVATIATLKCVGASSRLILGVYLVEVMAIGLAGIALGLAIGALLPVVLAAALGNDAPVPLALGLYGGPLALAAGFGVLTMLCFALWPLGRAARIAPGLLFRSTVVPSLPRPGWATVMPCALAALGLVALAVMIAPEKPIALAFAGGAAAALGAFHLLGHGIGLLARRARSPAIPWLRLGLANLGRPGAPTPAVVTALGGALAVLLAIALVQTNLARQIDEEATRGRPAFFFVDIQPAQRAPFAAMIEATPGAHGLKAVPMLRGRIVAINGVPVAARRVADGEAWAVRGDIGVTYAAEQPSNARIVAGEWWPADYQGEPLISFEADAARGLGIGLGDTLTINVLGREVTGRIASLREIEWLELDINFLVIFSPGVLEAAPQTGLATVMADPAASLAIERQVADAFPNVSAIPVRAILDALGDILSRVGGAVNAAAAIGLFAGLAVLAGAVAAGERGRRYDAVVLKVLGARRREIMLAFLVEYGALACATALIAAGIGILAAYGLVSQVLELGFALSAEPILALTAAAVAIGLIFGFAGTYRALGTRAAPLLREEQV
ncbi:MAG: ABC transporter permease [Alphaproteobacteria bacterium]